MATSCQAVTVYFNRLAQQGWGMPQAAFNPTQVYTIQFALPANQTMGVTLGNIHLVNIAAPSEGTTMITDFEGGNGAINPGMTNYLMGNTGFTYGVSGTPSALLSPMVDCGPGDGSSFAGHINVTWTSDTNYKGTQLTANLLSGTLATDCATSGVNYFNIAPFANGIQFDLKVVSLGSTGAPPSFDFFVGTANTLPACTWQGGSLQTTDCSACGSQSAWDNFSLGNFVNNSGAYTGTGPLPGADNTWHHIIVYWTDLGRQSWGDPVDPTCGWTWGYSSSSPPLPQDPTNGYINQSCYSNQITYLQWAASSGTDVGNNYNVEYWVDNVTFF
jgi:hypothetical protein